MDNHLYAHQILNNFKIDITTIDGNPITKKVSAVYPVSEFKTSFVLNKHVSISNKKVTQLEHYEDIERLGFQISKRRAPGLLRVGGRIEYFLVKRNPSYFDMGLIPPNHIVEYNFEDNWIRLVGQNSLGRKVFTYGSKKIRGKYNELTLEDMGSVYENMIAGLSPFTFQEEQKRMLIPEIPLVITDDGRLVCLPQRVDMPKIGIFGKNGTGKTLIMHMLLDLIYGKWNKRCVNMNDGVSFQTKMWSCPWDYSHINEEFKRRLEMLSHKTRPLPLFYLFQNTDDLKNIEMENEICYRTSMPYRDLLISTDKSFLQDIEDMGKSNKYLSGLIRDNQGKIRNDGLAYCKTIEDFEKIVNEQVFEERDEYDQDTGTMVVKRSLGFKVPDGVREKFMALLTNLYNSKILDINTSVPSKWIVKTPDGRSEVMYPWRACLYSEVIPNFVTAHIRNKVYFSAYYRFVMNDLFKMQQEELSRKNQWELWEFFDELQSLISYSSILEKFTEILKEARPNRIGIVYVTQYFGQIPQDIELNTDYIISFQQTKEMGQKILENFDGMKSMMKQIRILPKFQAIVAAKAGESLVVYDTEGKRTLIDDGTPFKGLVFPPVSQHSAPKQEGI